MEYETYETDAMEYETYETDDMYDYMDGEEPCKSKVWISNNFQQSSNIYIKAYFSEKDNNCLSQKSTEYDFNDTQGGRTVHKKITKPKVWHFPDSWHCEAFHQFM